MKRHSKLISLVLIMSLLVFGYVLIPTTQQVNAQQDKGAVESKIPIDDTNDLMKELKKLDAVKNYNDKQFGNLDWQGAELYSYVGVSGKTIVVPAKNSDSNRALLAYYSPDKSKFVGVIVMDVAFSNDMIKAKEAGQKDVPLSGTIKMFDTTGNIISGAKYDNDKVVEVYKKSDQVSAAWTDWDCFGDCIGSLWNDYPSWVRLLCEAACGSCIFAPNGISCSACIGCLGGRAWVCYDNCTY